MTEPKRYFWLKLQHDFFNSKRIKKLRKLAGGDTYIIIYLKMQLKALKTNGILTFSGIEPTFEEEIALDIDEDVDNVKITIAYLKSVGLLEQVDEGYELPYVKTNIGSETSTAQRVRNYRENQKALHCNTNVTQVKQICNGEIEIEKEIEKELEIEIDSSNKSKSKRFAKPTIEEISAYIQEKGYSVDANRFFDYYESNGWKVGRNPMKDWKACIRNWQSKEKSKDQQPTYKNAESVDEIRQRLFGKEKKVYTLDEMDVAEEFDFEAVKKGWKNG